MRLFLYYALHSCKNQFIKLCRSKTFVLIFFLILLSITFSYLIQQQNDLNTQMETEYTVQEIDEYKDNTFNINTGELIELIVGATVLVTLGNYIIRANKNGSKIFLPADVNLLFASPMKPQSALLFRLSAQLGLIIFGSLYVIPYIIINSELNFWTALSIGITWLFTLLYGVLIQTAIYTLSFTYPQIKRYLLPVIFTVLLLVTGGFALFYTFTGGGILKAATSFFNAPLTRIIPVWGWLKSLSVYAFEGNFRGALLSLLILVTGLVLLIISIWRIDANFYESAIAQSEETSGFRNKNNSLTASHSFRNKKHNDLKRDALHHGSGANIFFFKALYNRFRFAYFRIFTKTMGFYLITAAVISIISRFILGLNGILFVALGLSAVAFYRSLANPLGEDVKKDYFLLIPESTRAKLFWSLLGGTVSCFLDVLPAVLLGALLTESSFITAISWIPFILSVDFYAVNVGTFIGLSISDSIDKSIKQVAQIIFLYFGLVPDIVLIAVYGIALNRIIIGVFSAAFLNFGLGFIFLLLTPLFLDTRSRPKQPAFKGNLKTARKHFSILGLGAFTILVVSFLFQFIMGEAAEFLYPGGNEPDWFLWFSAFVPMYMVAVPCGLLIFKLAPADPPLKHNMKLGKFITALIICIFLMYSGNFIGIIVLSLLEAVFGLRAINPLDSFLMDSSLWIQILVVVIIGPVIEEYIFRKQLIDRMNAYGERTAIITSALLFGLFHGNLSQFFYAFLIGLVFGYVYVKTGQLKYSAALHMILNFTGGILPMLLLERIDFNLFEQAELGNSAAQGALYSQILPMIIYLVILAVLFIAGFILLCLNIKSLSFNSLKPELPKGEKFKTVYWNVGMMLLLISTIISIFFSFEI